MRKQVLKIVIAGHVDHGKSTMIGRLLIDTDSLPSGKIDEIKRISRALGKDTELAYLADQLREEREQAITIDTTQLFFKSRRRNYVIIDAPGHARYIRNMITGASMADAAVLIVDVQKGIGEQTRRHAYIINMLGIENVLAVLNKMDLVGYEQEAFDRVSSELLGVLEKLDIEPACLIPISAKTGDNVSRRSKKLGWHRGPTLLEGLDSLSIAADAAASPLRFPVQDVFEVGGENIAVGRVASGTVKKGQGVVILPSFEEARVRCIRVFERRKAKASRGDNIGIVFDGSPPIKRGNVVVQKGDDSRPTYRFEGSVFWMSSLPLLIDEPMVLRCATQEVECVVEGIRERIDSSTLEVIEPDAKRLDSNEAGVAIFRTAKPVMVEKFSFVEELGRFVVERDHNLLGAGIVTDRGMRS